jgi:hypothetical protein
VEAGRRGVVLFREGIDSVPIVGQLESHGFRRIPVGAFVVFAPRAG